MLRSVLAAGRLALGATMLALPAAAQPAAREQTADQQVLHALGRLAFGPRPGDVAAVRAMGVDRWIERQLAPARLPDAPGDAIAARHPALALPLAALLERYPPPRPVRSAARGGATMDSTALRRELLDARRRSAALFAELQAARVGRAVASERQLQEVMVDFWANHFNVFAQKGPLARHHLVVFERDAIRPHALGRFRDLLGAVAHSPAMLFYLDNAQSRADVGAPTLARGRPRPPAPGAQRSRGLNENYARELLELHTLGVDGGYTQQDVVEVARALTGWTIAPPREGSGFVFRPALHDAGAKTVLGTRLPAGRGVEDGEQVLDLLARHPSTARFVATKLVRRFVSDSPPPALVERAAAAFQRTDGDLREVVRTIVTSPEFFSAGAYRAKVKSPFELVTSALRALGAAPDATPRTAQAIARLGQPLHGHQAPNGWPETGAAWINAGAILGRIDFGLGVAGGALPGVALDGWPLAATLATAPREQQVDGVVHALLGGGVSSDTRRFLLAGENPLQAQGPGSRDQGPRAMSADSSSLDDARPRARFTRTAPRRLDGLALIVGLALGSPEFQRR